jgi:hypothetical protein
VLDEQRQDALLEGDRVGLSSYLDIGRHFREADLQTGKAELYRL